MSRGLLRATAVVGANTVLSRILGFVRDMVIARAFGAGAATDAFFVAFRLPNLLRRLFAEGAFSNAFVPVLSEYRGGRSEDEVRDLAAHVAGALGAILFLVSLAGVVAAPLLVLVFAPGFLHEADTFAVTVHMVRITFPYILFISLTSFAGGILNTYGRFGVPAFTPVLLNLCLIGAAIGLAPHMAHPVVALAWGVFAAGVVQLAFQLPFLHGLRLLVRPRIRLGHEGVRRIVGLIVPAALGASVAQVNLLVDTLIASFLPSGSISWLYYSDRMVEFPLGVFGIALATVILPRLSHEHAADDPRAFSATLDWALRWVLIVVTPSAIGLAVLAGPVLSTLFQHGQFSAHDVEMALRSLIAFASGLLGFVGVKVLAPGYFARQDTRTPVRIAIVALVSNVVFNLILVWPLRHAGLALATALSAFINAGLLYRGLRRAGVHRPQPGWRGLIVRVAAANAIMGVLVWHYAGGLDWWLAAHVGARVARLALLVAAGAGTYALALLALGVRPRALLHPESAG